MPTKALLHAAEVADAARESAAYGIRSSFEGVDMPGVHAYKESGVGRLYRGLQGLVSSAGITLVHGQGQLVGSRRVTSSHPPAAGTSAAGRWGSA